MPSGLGIAKIYGLNDFNRFAVPTPPAGNVRWTVAPPSATVPVTGLLRARDMWTLYDMPATNFGEGESMAIIGWGVTDPVLPSLRSFEAENGLPAIPLTIKKYGDTSTPDTNDGATGEWELDTQSSSGMAPNAVALKLYFGHHPTDADLLAAITAWVNDRSGPRQASASFGECENITAAQPIIGTDGLEGPGDVILKQAVIEGRTLFASTGDNGSSCNVTGVNTNGLTTQAYPALEYPSASPWAVAVGGTDLNSNGAKPPQRLSETAWEYGGGGNSTSEPAGSYQSSVATATCAFDASGNPWLPTSNPPPCRSTPDVSAMSGDVFTGNGLAITDDSGPDQQGAGTSLSSPLTLGMWTRINAASRAHRHLGFANFSIYRAAQSSAYAADFFDVIAGDNVFYPALPGYDNATGWGVIDVAHLMTQLTGNATPAHVTTPQPVPPIATVSCGPLFTDPAGDEVYAVQGQTLGAQGTQPQLDIISGQIKLSLDGTTLRTIITVRNLSTVIPTGGVENDYNFTWTHNGTTYFTQLAVEPTGVINAYDGQLLKLSLENRYQQFHVDTAVFVPGTNGIVEVDVPLANVGSPAIGQTLFFPSAASYVRESVLAGPLEPVDTTSVNNSYQIAGGCP